MRIEVLTSTAQTAVDASKELRMDLAKASSRAPDFVALHASCNLDLTALCGGLDLPVTTALHGATSSNGIISHHQSTLEHPQGAGLFAIWEEDGDFGSAVRPLDDDPRARSHEAALSALEMADRPGEVPDLVWLSVTPGQEELVLQGIRDAIGDEVPIVGGSAADNDLSGQWAVFDNAQVLGNGVVVSMLFLDGHHSDAFQSGYSPSTASGRVTRAVGRRILEIDHKPAALVYEKWTNGRIATTDTDKGSRNILADSTLSPLARQVQRRDGQSDYLLVHPAATNPDLSIDVFAEVPEGEMLTLMEGTRAALVDRAGQVADMSRGSLPKGRVEPKGALVIFCGGCMMAMGDEIGQVTDRIRANLPDVPFLGVFTFGEQGHIPSGGNWHGNLMISCITFGA
ncbi:MAG: FIST C-terminal domain-containing protein [Epibacterium sp.]|nr:FIST C-terminal domain-containing protein [Epibacterium sp.]NQX74885.1 FIST C-terminal domain-containing protein [Epibacterium sp.]